MKKIILLSTILVFNYFAKAQGCSDAGFCSIGSLKPSVANSKTALSIGSAFGVGDQSINVVTPYLQLDTKFKNDWALQTKLTYNSASKDGFTISGMGDAFIVAIKNFTTKNKEKIAANIGVKLPLGSANNKEKNGIALPLSFQPTLGTVDFLAGVTIEKKGLLVAIATQIPLTKNTNNEYYNSSFPLISSIASTRLLNRKADILGKLNYTIKVNKSFNLNLGELTILHLANDNYTDLANNKIEIDKSNGVTININLGASWMINKKLSFNFLAGFPMLTRKIRPDGLTRSFVIIPELKWNL